MTRDPAFLGAALTAAMAVIVGALFRRHPATVAVWVAVVAGFYLLARNPYAGTTVLMASAMWIVHRWGLLHLLKWGGVALAYAAIFWQNIAAGMLLPAAMTDALGRLVHFAFWAWLAFIAWRIAKDRLGYLANPLIWNAETRRVQQNAEYRRAMGLRRRGAGWAGRRTRQAITGRPPPALPRPPDQLDATDRDDLAVLARRDYGIDPEWHTTDELRHRIRDARARPPEPATARPHPSGPPPATAEARPADPQPEPVLIEMHGTAGGIIPEPFVQPTSWRWRSR